MIPSADEACRIEQVRGFGSLDPITSVKQPMHPLLATNYSGFNEVLVGGALLVLGLSLFSFWPAAHGHWASVIFAVPSFVFGGLLLSVFSGPPSGLALITLTLLSIFSAVGSISLWRHRKIARNRPGTRHEKKT